MRARLRSWWRQWTGLTELEQRNTRLQDEVAAVRRIANREIARERSRIPQFNELVAEKDQEIQRLIREVGSLERQLREQGRAPVTVGPTDALPAVWPPRPTATP